MIKRIFILLVCISLLVCLFLIGISLFDYYHKKKLDDYFESTIKEKEEIIEKIRSNELEIDEFGKVILTDKYDKVAEDNYVSVLVNDENKVVVSFLYKAGFPDEAQYIFYTSNDDSLIREYVDDSLYSYIKKIDNNWYFVQLN